MKAALGVLGRVETLAALEGLEHVAGPGLEESGEYEWRGPWAVLGEGGVEEASGEAKKLYSWRPDQEAEGSRVDE